jgi:N-acetylmuramoyl-L-alanine amidase
MIKNFFYISILLFSFSCQSGKYAATNKSYKKQASGYAKVLKQYPLKDSTNTNGSFVGTTNFNMRKPNFVIIHHTAQNSCEQTLKTFTLVRTQVSAHYVICKDGTIHHMLNDYLRAWHAGASKWGNVTDLNSSSIGIELDNNGFEPFAESQLKSLTNLLATLKKTYSIPTANFIGHADIAPVRKNDPNKYFPWQQFARQGYGLWYDTISINVPTDFNTKNALRIIGYNVKNENDAIKAYKLHYNNTDTTTIISTTDKKILYSLQLQN